MPELCNITFNLFQAIKTRIALLLFCVGLSFVSATAWATTYDQQCQCKDGTIILYPKPDPVDNPRSQNQPFTAFQYGTNVEIFSADGTFGTVGVYLFSTAGDLVSTTFDTSTGSIILPISGLSGSYTIIITVPGGTTFEGQFVIL